MTLIFSTLAAVLPSLLLLRYFYRRDLNPEPRGALVKTFLLGVLIVIPVVIVVVPLLIFSPRWQDPFWVGLYGALICAAIPEEFFKYLVITRYSARHPAFNEPMDGIVYGATASLGFATLENIMYVTSNGWGVAISRALTAVPCHACLGAILGYYIGQARFRNSKRLARTGLLIAILLHASYDYPLMVMDALTPAAGITLVLVPGLM
ncbi:MAG TPA: PrsW family glutamic-type intramembrane protease, partial [bacterium]|nr:PrsW family glutamic-type intramembrane protease [bacterium]